MSQYGYVRVSTKEQNPERQLRAMKERGISPQCIYMDKMSGKDFQRTEYQKLIRKLKKGDLLTVWGEITERFWSNGAESPGR